jgi:ferrous iron transport protein B
MIVLWRAIVFTIPANEIVIPTILMLMVLVTGAGAGVMFETGDAGVLAILTGGGWTLLTAINLMLFC